MSNAVLDKKREFKVPGLPAYYIALAVDIILLYLMNNIKYINISFIDQELFASCLWAINLVLGMGIMGNFFLLLYRPKWFYHFTQMVLNFLVAFGLYIIFRVFPFSFDQEMIKTAVKIVLIVVTAGIGLSAVYEMIRFIIDFIAFKRSKHLPAQSAITGPPEQIIGPAALPTSPGIEMNSSSPITPTSPQIIPDQFEKTSQSVEASPPSAPVIENANGTSENPPSDTSSSISEQSPVEKQVDNNPASQV